MMKKSLLAGALLLCPAAFAATTHWEYSGEAGPAKWASLTPEYGQCAGSNQSPVNLSGLVKADLAPCSSTIRRVARRWSTTATRCRSTMPRQHP